MKVQSLLFNYLPKKVKKLGVIPFFDISALSVFILFLYACTGTPKDDNGTPPLLYHLPEKVILNPEGGYQFNTATGRVQQPLTDAFGKPIITGQSIPVEGKIIHSDSLTKPKKVYLNRKPKQVEAHINSFKILESLTKTSVIESSLEIFNEKNRYSDFILTNPFGDTIPTGQILPISGKSEVSFLPPVSPSLVPRIKENALYDIQNLSIEQGLTSSFVNDFLVDIDGNIWFGSFSGGITRYDGKYLLQFSETEGLSHNSVNRVIQDKAGNLWLGTNGGGVNKFDGKEFVHFTTTEGLSNNTILAILEDKQGNLWFGTNGGGVSKYIPPKNEQEGIIIHFTTAQGLSNNKVTSILEDSSGFIWFGTDGGGLNRYEPSTGNFVHFTVNEGLSHQVIKSLLEDKSGNLWIGTDGGGVNKYEKPTNYDLGYFVQYTTHEGLSHNSVHSILEDSSGNLWFGTFGGGVNKLERGANGDEGSFIHIGTSEGLPNNFVNALWEDKVGNIWIGSQGGGVSRFNVKSFVHLTEAEGLSDNRVISILQDRSGQIWFGTQGGGLNKYIPGTSDNAGAFFHYTILEGLLNNNVWDILEDVRGNLWISNYGAGISRLTLTEDGNVESLVHFTTKEGLSNNTVRSILEDSSGNLWFGTFGGGLTKFIPSKEGIDGTFIHFTEKQGLSSDYVRELMEDKSGNIWIGSDGGVSKFTPKDEINTGTFIHYTTHEGLSNNSIWSLIEDRDGNIWFGTGGAGVSRFEPAKNDREGSISNFTTNEGISNKFVNAILEDNSGILWFATGGGGISRYHPTRENKTESFLHLTSTEGLSNNTVRSLLKDMDGYLWFGTQGGGVSKIKEDAFRQSNNPPRIHLRQVNIKEALPDYLELSREKNKAIRFDSIQKFENYPINLNLLYDQNHLVFFFSALEWESPHQIHYSHRILGLDDTWSTPSTDVKADYRNLPPGKFLFQVRAIGQSQIWSDPFEYAFAIHPPWWHTWWAYLIYSLVLVLSLFRFVRWRTERLKERNVELEEKVKERTLQLEMKSEDLSESLEKLKSTQAQLIHAEKMASLGELTAGVAHEIQNPLNFVNNFSEVSVELLEEIRDLRLKTQDTRPKAEEDEMEDEILEDVKLNLEKIRHHGKRADAIVKGMLEHSRTSTGEKVLTDINALADEYLRLSYHGMRAKDKSFNANFQTDFDPNLPKVNVVPQDIGRVLLNIINNAFQATNELSKGSKPLESFKPLVTVSTTPLQGGRGVQITISDNGPGIPDHIKDKIFQPFFTTKPTGQGTGLGLSLSYDIVKAHGGEISVESKLGEGTEFVINLPYI